MDYRILPSGLMDVVGMWTMLMIMANVWSIAEFKKRKEIAAVITGMVALIISFALFEIVILSCHLSGYGRAASADLSRMLPSKKLFISMLVIVSIISIVMICHHVFVSYHRLSERSISYCVDSMPVGICYYSKNGRILLTNACMKQICYDLTGKALLNAFDFTENAGSDYISLSNNTIWKVEQNQKEYDDGTVYEIICSDVSELVKKKRKLEEKNKDAAELGKKLRLYQLNIDELIRKKEILKAKMDIHDDMNSLMLMTVAAIDASDDNMLNEAMTKWSQNALLATKEVKRSENEFKNVTDLAAMLGIKITNEECVKLIPKEYLELYCVIAREALINVSKHSDATTLIMSVERDEGLRFTFENDKIISKNTDTTNMTGGLDSIKRLVTEQGGKITAKYDDDRFILEVIFEEYQFS